MLLNLFIVLFICLMLIMFMEKYIKINNNILIFLLVTIFSFIAALRGLETADTISYANFYTNIGTSISDISNQYVYERGYVLANIVMKSLLGNNFRAFFFCLSFFNCLLVAFSLKKLGFDRLIIPLILYISFYGVYFNFTILRAGLAFSFLLLSWTYLNEKKNISIVTFLIALSLHSSVLFTLPVYLFIYEKKGTSTLNFQDENSSRTSTIMYIVWSFLILIIYLLRPERILFTVMNWLNTLSSMRESRYYYYFINVKFGEGISLRIIFNILLSFIFIFKGNMRNIAYKKFLNVYLFGLTILALFSYFLWIERTTDFYIAIGFILLTFILDENKQKIFSIIITMVLLAINMSFVYRIIF